MFVMRYRCPFAFRVRTADNVETRGFDRCFPTIQSAIVLAWVRLRPIPHGIVLFAGETSCDVGWMRRLPTTDC